MDFSVFFEHAVDLDGVDSSARDAGGGTVNAFTSKATGVACSLLVTGGGETVEFGQTQLPNEATLKTYSTAFDRGDRVTVTRGPNLLGAVFRVVGIGSQPGMDFLGIPDLTTVSLKGWQ
jgi:hypothetical protein